MASMLERRLRNEQIQGLSKREQESTNSSMADRIGDRDDATNPIKVDNMLEHEAQISMTDANKKRSSPKVAKLRRQLRSISVATP